MTTPPTRDRLIRAMGNALQHKGLHGVGLSEILAAAATPKGGLYHHFPGGKTELAVAAIEQQVADLCALLDKLLPGADPVAALQLWIARAQQGLAASGFQRGCPLATVALESSAQDVAIRQALAAGFAAIRARLALAFEASGRIANAAGLAALIVAAYEGALLQARVAGSVAPMELVGATLFPLLRAQLQGPRNDQASN